MMTPSHTHRRARRWVAVILAPLPWTAVGSAAAQVPALPPARSWFAMTGEASILAEAYGISGREPRRPGATASVLFRPEFQVTRFLRVGLDLQLTAEGVAAGAGAHSPTLNAARQRLNQLGISPTWSWGKMDLGDFTDSYSPYTFSGVRVRGAGVAVNPGFLRLAAFSGQAQSAVLGLATNTSYDRSVAGGRAGVGRANGSFFDLILVRTWDDPNSLPAPGDTAFIDPRTEDPTVDPDTLAVGTLLNPLSVTPQENVVAAAAGRLILLGGNLRLQGELSGAGYTRDVRASALDNESLLDEIPGLMRGLFTPHIGSSFGLAYATSADLRIGTFVGTGSYRQVAPGYVALGVASLLNDQRGWTVGGTNRFGRSTTLRLDAARQHDNLVGQKSFTTNRDRYGAAFTMRPVPRLTSSLRVQYVGMHNDVATDAPQWIDYANWIVASNHTVSLGRSRLFRSFGWSYTYRNSGDENPVRAASNLTAHAATVRVVLAPSAALSITPSVGVNASSSGAAREFHRRQTYGIAAQMRAREGRWTSSLSLGSTDDRGVGAFQMRMSSRYRLTEADIVTFAVRASRYRNAPNPFGAAGSFNERTVSLQLSRRLGDGS